MDAQGWDERYAAGELVWSAGPNQFVEEALADLPPGRAVDLAAGEGRNAIWLARRGWQVTAVDFSRIGLEKGRRVAGDVEIEWVCADATTWSAPEPVDLVVIAYLQLPAAERAAAVRHGFDALRPGGTFFLVAHDSTNIAEGSGGPQDPSVLYTAGDVLADLDGRDVEVVRAERVTRVVTAEDGHGGEERRTALDALVHLHRR
ncbi:MAG TPA: class I SAM-dependent methyltransferase [Marmoricola sp.]|nr:class I SAM-dependent methyltransferase [Marmoricola sp.]